MTSLNLSADEVLTTTRSVRKRLDLEKPVPRGVLLECLELAIQAPTGSNQQGWQWVFVEDADKKKALGDIYRKNFEWYRQQSKPEYAEGDARAEQQDRVVSSATYLVEHMHEAPVLMIPCLEGDVDPVPGGRRRIRRPGRRVVLGLATPGGVELHACAAVARAGIGLDHAAPDQSRRTPGRRAARHPLRAVPAGRPVPCRVHQGHRFPARQAAAR